MSPATYARSALAALLLAIGGLVAAAPAPAPRVFHVDYGIALTPGVDEAVVTIRIGKGAEHVRRLNFRIDPKRHTQLRADGELAIEGNRAIWQPPARGGTLTLHSKINHQRRKGDYDAHINRSWAIFRGDDVIPAAKARLAKGATSRAHLRFALPPGWTNVDTGWPKGEDGRFIIDNPQRAFDRPVGWMIAGEVGTRRDQVGATELAVGAPKGSGLHRLDVLTFLNFVWPEMESALGKVPPKLLVVGAADPMWRGGLSSTNSMFLHAERPLVSENGTSALLHELVHIVTRVRGQPKDDWIAEGIAEFYAGELLYRAGGMSEARHDKLRRWLLDWGKDVKSLRLDRSTGPVTARAAVLLQDLDREIRRRTDDRRDLDDVVRKLMRIGKVSLADLRTAAQEVIGGKATTLDSPLLR
ncbi:MAG: hypothetical protein JNJ74_08170 [Xanthomonadales bacterium]|nr:hypothetical protein [Xanthomonadales bacterium]